MCTETCRNIVSELDRSTHNETMPSDLEISRRVSRIRAGWSLSERIRRRHQAEQRFAELIDKLIGDQAA